MQVSILLLRVFQVFRLFVTIFHSLQKLLASMDYMLCMQCCKSQLTCSQPSSCMHVAPIGLVLVVLVLLCTSLLYMSVYTVSGLVARRQVAAISFS